MTADAAWPADALEVGRIGEAWGLKGWFKVQSFASPPESLLVARAWHLKPSERSPQLASLPAVLEIRQVKEHGDSLVATARGIDDRTGAEGLRGARIFVARSSFPAAGADEFYPADLIGLAVVNREGADLGRVAGLIDTGPHSVLRLAPPEGAAPGSEERLIPFVSAYVDSVEVAAGRIVVDWGLDF